MKRLFFLQYCLSVFLCISMCYISTAQKFSISLGGGYGIQLAPADIADGNVLLDSSGTQTNELIIFSYGSGWQLESAINYHLLPHLSLGIGVSYLHGATTAKHITHPNFDKVRSSNGKMLRFTPHIKFYLPKENYEVYISVGYLAGIGRITMENRDTYFDLSRPDLLEKRVYTKGLSHGITSAVGAKIKVSPHIALFVETKVYVQSFGARKGELTVSTENGIDQLPELETIDILTDFVNEHTAPVNAPIDTNIPRKELRRFYPFSSVGLTLGINFML